MDTGAGVGTYDSMFGRSSRTPRVPRLVPTTTPTAVPVSRREPTLPHFSSARPFFPEEIPLSLSGEILQAFQHLKQQAPGRNIAARYVIDSYNEWCPHQNEDGSWNFGRSALVFDEFPIRLNDYQIVKIVPSRVQIQSHSPYECRLANMDYLADYFVMFVFIDLMTGEQVILPLGGLGTGEILLFSFPVMLGSNLGHITNRTSLDEIVRLGECISDPFGYFVIGGNERFLIVPERNRTDRISVYYHPDKSAKDKKSPEFLVSRMTSRYLHITRITEVRYMTMPPQTKVGAFKANKIEAFQKAGIPLTAQDLKGYDPAATLPSTLPFPSLRLNLNCFEEKGVLLLPFVVYYFRNIMFSGEELEIMDKKKTNLGQFSPAEVEAIKLQGPVPPTTETIFGEQSFFVDATIRLFENLRDSKFIEPSIYDEVRNLMMKDLVVVLHDFQLKEYKQMSFFEAIEDYIYWHIRPQNISYRYVEVEGRQLQRGRGALKRFTSNGKVIRSQMSAIIRKYFFAVSDNVDEDDEEILKQSFYTVLGILSRFLSVYFKVSEEDDLNDMGIRCFITPGRLFEDLIGRQAEIFIEEIQDRIRTGREKKRTSKPMTELAPGEVGEIIQRTIGGTGDKYRPGRKNLDMTAEIRAGFTKTKTDYARSTPFASESIKRENMICVVAAVTNKKVPRNPETKGPASFGIRILKMSELGLTDPSETPERKMTGLVKHSAMTCEMSFDRDSNPQIIREKLAEWISYDPQRSKYGSVHLNGKFIGWASAGYPVRGLSRWLRDLRRFRTNFDALVALGDTNPERTLSHDIQIYYDQITNSLHIATDSSRPVRPLLVVENAEPLFFQVLRDYLGKPDLEITVAVWREFAASVSAQGGDPVQYLFDNGAIEYVDAREQINNYIAERIEDLINRKKLLARAEEIAPVVYDRVNLPALEAAEREILRLKGEKITGEALEIAERKALELRTANIRAGELKSLIDEHKNHFYTHCEIDPLILFGYVAATIPRANCTTGPRNTLQGQMIKQAMGTYNSNPWRMDVAMRNLAFPSRPIFETEGSKFVKMDAFPTGQMITLAVSSLLGATQEDSLILDLRALDYGVFNHVVMRTKKKEIKIKDRNDNRIIHPYNKEYKNSGHRLRDRYVYRNIHRNGLPRLGEYFREGDCIIGCIRKKNNVWEDDSVYVGPGEEGRVDAVYLFDGFEKRDIGGVKGTFGDSTGSIVIKVRIRNFSTPDIGDKYALRYGQKRTAGLNLYVHELPYGVDGMVPTVILNPHAIPARSTVGMLTEFLASQYGALYGKRVNATTFKHFDQENYEENLVKSKLRPYTGEDCIPPVVYETVKLQTLIQQANKALNLTPTFLSKQKMFSGTTGLPYAVNITLTPVYDCRLKQWAGDKFQVRSRGFRSNITFEPNQGRGQGGATRFGWMELSAIMAQGADEIVNDRMSYASGEAVYMVCTKCGRPAERNIVDKFYKCSTCSELGRTTTSLEALLAYDKRRRNNPDIPLPPFIMLRTRRAWCAYVAYLAGLGIKCDVSFEPRPPFGKTQ